MRFDYSCKWSIIRAETSQQIESLSHTLFSPLSSIPGRFETFTETTFVTSTSSAIVLWQWILTRQLGATLQRWLVLDMCRWCITTRHVLIRFILLISTCHSTVFAIILSHNLLSLACSIASKLYSLVHVVCGQPMICSSSPALSCMCISQGRVIELFM